MTNAAPAHEIARVADAQARFNARIVGLDDGDVARSSALPGWTVGHVLTHVARNADSHVRRAEAAVRDEVVEQYPGGYEGRAAEIEAGAARSSAEIIDDVRNSAAVLAATWAVLPDAAWGRLTIDVGGRERALAQLVSRRWQELEVHVVDLDVGVTYRDWPDEFVTAWLPKVRVSLPGRLPAGAEVPASGVLDDRAELAWLYGRLQRPDLPVLAPWG